MKAVILAAGKGKRMGELTKFLPKPLLPIDNRPFLLYTIKNLKQCGCEEIAIIVSYQKEKIEEFLKENKINAVLIDQKEPKGTGHALKCAENFCKNDSFLVLNGDNYYSAEAIKEMNQSNDYNLLCGLVHENPSKYGVIIQKNGLLEKMIEKPKEYVGNLINIGLYRFTPEVFKALNMIKLSERGEYELTDALTLLAQNKKVKVIKSTQPWFDLGSPEDIAKIEEFFKQKKLAP